MRKPEGFKQTGTDRRSFLKGAALIGAGVAATSVAAACTPDAKTEEPTTGTGGGTGGATAGTKYTTYSNPDEIGTVHETSNEETFDVVVVGTGVTGLSCAMLTAEQAPDAKVLLIDKMGGPGGNTNLAELNGPVPSMTWDEALAAAMERNDDVEMDLTDPFLYAHVLADKGKDLAWFYTERGVELADDLLFYKGHNGTLAVKGLVEQIETDPAYANVDYRLNTQAITLLTSDEHTVTGVQIKNTTSEEYTNVTAKAVMLATGGMGTNLELLSFYTGEDVVEKSVKFGQGQDGDGHLMVEYTAHGHSKSVDPTPMWAVVKDMALESALSCCIAMQKSGLYVNQAGLRFHDESFPKGAYPEVDHSMMQQGRVFSIVGQNMIDQFQTEGSNAPAFYYFQVPTDLSEELAQVDSNPNIYVADTFEDLAEKIGLPVDAFVEQINRYEADAKAGTGDSEFGKDARLTVPLGDPPYYAGEIWSIMMQTNSGIRINTDCQVVDPYYVPIAGLYAGGIAVSGFNTSRYTGGTSQSVGLWSGCKAARVIVENELGGTVADDWYGPKEYDGPYGDFMGMELLKPLPGQE
ncbi:MAG: FAD-binding protein [Bifidobacteriaceae bacterium]|jgi:fumarate reductase flavoprotein subunit|nr:FAD-binding protein [Bifidobacteriaceae bacterium]